LLGVAVPQYDKYIRKSKTVEGITLIKSIIRGEILYHAVHGKYLAISHSMTPSEEEKLRLKLGVTIPNFDTLDGSLKLVKVIVCTNDAFIVWIGTNALDKDKATSKISSVYPVANDKYVRGFQADKYRNSFFLYDYVQNETSLEAPIACANVN